MALFDHENLKVYQRSINFNAWWTKILEGIAQSPEIRKQMERAMVSVTLNLAEGNGKTSSSDRCRFFEIARGSSLECAACLDLIVARNILPKDEVQTGKELLSEIVAMIVGLIRSLEPNRLLPAKPDK